MTKSKFPKKIDTAKPVSDELERERAGAGELIMFSTRITNDDAAYIKEASFYLGMSKQEIFAEALKLFRENNPLKK